MKQAQKTKKSLQEICKERLDTIQDARRQKEEAAKRERYREVEDEVMAMTYGPNWKTRMTGEKDEVQNEVPDAEESQVRLKAS